MDDLKQPPAWFPCIEGFVATTQDIDALELELERVREEVRRELDDDPPGGGEAAMTALATALTVEYEDFAADRLIWFEYAGRIAGVLQVPVHVGDLVTRALRAGAREVQQPLRIEVRMKERKG